MNNINTTNPDIARVVTIVRYVDINFNVNNVLYESHHLIPNTLLETPIHEPIYLGISNSKKRYNVIYDWTYNNVSYPILVPDINTTYQASLILLTIPDEQAHILCDSYGKQRMGSFYNLTFTYPLYFKATTIEIDSDIEKEVLVDPTYVVNQDNTYTHQMNFVITDPILIPGIPKNYTITLELYKDLLKTKYIGSITLSANISSTITPGD